MHYETGTYGQKVITAGNAVQLVNASPRRSAIKITNLSAVDVWIGYDKSVTPASGDLLLGIRGAWIAIETNAPIWAIVADASLVPVVSYMEILR